MLKSKMPALYIQPGSCIMFTENSGFDKNLSLIFLRDSVLNKYLFPQVEDMNDVEIDDMFACLLLCAVLDQNSTKIKRRREFWRQNKPPHGLKLESRYLSITGETLSENIAIF